MIFQRRATNKRICLIEQTKGILYILLFVLAFEISLYSQSVKALNQDEYQVKAAFIYNFIAFTQLPDSEDLEIINMCIYGKDYFEKEVDALEEKKVNNFSIQIKRINQLAEIKQCQVLFISRSHQGELPVILDSIKEQPILTIADSPDGASMGVMINMHLDQNKVKFEINLNSARTSRLNISSRLLQLATQIYR